MEAQATNADYKDLTVAGSGTPTNAVFSSETVVGIAAIQVARSVVSSAWVCVPASIWRARRKLGNVCSRGNALIHASVAFSAAVWARSWSKDLTPKIWNKKEGELTSWNL